MKFLKTKLFLVVLFIVITIFFSSDFGLIDIEKTAIITAVAIDYEDTEGQYLVTAQIAVPEATDTNEEKTKAVITGKGGTVGAAIKDIGNVSGWFPKLSFCNLIILGNSFNGSNVIRTLDYFAKTLRVQDSAMVVMAENDAKELLEATSPLDEISSFAIQKVLVKKPGFDKDVATTDIRTFASGYYDNAKSSYMPIVKLNDQIINSNKPSSGGGEDKLGSAGQQSGGSQKSSGDTLFDASSTALFLEGKKVGELDRYMTRTLNLLLYNSQKNTLEINGVDTEVGGVNYLLTLESNSPTLKLIADKDKLQLKMQLDIYCRVSDQNSNSSASPYPSNTPLPLAVKEKATQLLYERVNNLFEIQKQSGCDFLGVKKMLYRYYYNLYSQYKDNYLSVLKPLITINLSGQK